MLCPLAYATFDSWHMPGQEMAKFMIMCSNKFVKGKVDLHILS